MWWALWWAKRSQGKHRSCSWHLQPLLCALVTVFEVETKFIQSLCLLPNKFLSRFQIYHLQESRVKWDNRSPGKSFSSGTSEPIMTSTTYIDISHITNGNGNGSINFDFISNSKLLVQEIWISTNALDHLGGSRFYGVKPVQVLMFQKSGQPPKGCIIKPPFANTGE